MIAMALACNPSLLIADEPTTALDVTIQAQILDLSASWKQDTGASVMLITHDLGVIAETADRVIVMYAGQIVETGDVDTIFDRPMHPYTSGLLQSIPRLTEDKDRLHSIEESFRARSTCRRDAGLPRDARWPMPTARARESAKRCPRGSRTGHAVRCVKAGKEATA